MESYAVYVGFDGGRERHHVCVVDGAGGVQHEQALEHDAAALHEVIDGWIEQAGGQAGRVAVAIEVPHGVVVETLLERGVSVWAINPKQLDRFRDRFSAAGAKDDRRDAHVLADSLRTDPRAFRRVELTAAELIELREDSRLHDELRAQSVQLGNRLRDQLLRYYPQLLALGAVDEPWLWELWELAPSPAQVQGLTAARVEPLLKQHRIRRLTAAQVLTRLGAAAFSVAPGVEPAARRHIEVLVAQLRLLHTQRRQCDQRLAHAMARLVGDPSEVGPVRELSDAAILLSLPGVGNLVGATVLAEAGGPLSQLTRTTLRPRCGTAPVTQRSGKQRQVTMRHACNARLREACHYWGNTAVQTDARARAQYQRLRAGGCTHARAVRGVVDRLLDVLLAMLRDRTQYDPARYATSAQRGAAGRAPADVPSAGR
jgi:hypothetical protein